MTGPYEFDDNPTVYQPTEADPIVVVASVNQVTVGMLFVTNIDTGGTEALPALTIEGLGQTATSERVDQLDPIRLVFTVKTFEGAVEMAAHAILHSLRRDAQPPAGADPEA